MRDHVRCWPRPCRVCECRRARMSKARVFGFCGFRCAGVAVIDWESGGVTLCFACQGYQAGSVHILNALSACKWLWQ